MKPNLFSQSSLQRAMLTVGLITTGLLNTGCGGGGETLADIPFANARYISIDPAPVNYAYKGVNALGGLYGWSAANPGFGDYWWSGPGAPAGNGAPATWGAATDNFYWGGASRPWNDYMESWVSAPSQAQADINNMSTISLTGQTKLQISVWGNPELGTGTPIFTPVLRLPKDANNCHAEAQGPVLTPQVIGKATYEILLKDFVVTQNCGNSMTTSSFLSMPIQTVRVRIYKDRYPGDGQPVGINLGEIIFKL
ncbi:hypothetical protein ACHEXK_06295 [Limnohabitans sp. DCL3]|uniref:hypothetical protein n=1 Tax=Limnohabitans sp. DCL3 TaxID=3374103 RepID=UPI003A8B68FA